MNQKHGRKLRNDKNAINYIGSLRHPENNC